MKVNILNIQVNPRPTRKMVNQLRLEDAELKEFEEFVREIQKQREDERNLYIVSVKDDPESTLAILIYEVKSGRGPARRNAIRVLGNVGVLAKPAVPHLIKALTSEDVETRELASNALQQIDPSVMRVRSCQFRGGGKGDRSLFSLQRHSELKKGPVPFSFLFFERIPDLAR